MELVVKNRDGTPVTHDVTKNTVRMVGADGEAKDFVSADDVPVAVAKTVELDFSGGDMTVTPEEGQTFSSILIPKPPNLIPENVPEDVDIAGVIGAMAAGGGSAKFAWAQMDWLTTGGVLTVEHGLGMVPDFVLISADVNYEAPKLNVAYGLSRALIDAIGIDAGKCVGQYFAGATSTSTNCGRATTPMDELTAGPYIHNVTNANFTFGSDEIPTAQYSTIYWLAIGGLT